MKEWWVYELCAGRWRYSGMTSNLRRRKANHRAQIKSGNKPSNWDVALTEFPNPDDWEMRVLSGPFESKDEAIAEEEKLQKADWDNPGRLWERCGTSRSEREVAQRSGSGHHYYGKFRAQDVKDKIAATLKNQQQSAATKAKRKATWARKRAEKAASQ